MLYSRFFHWIRFQCWLTLYWVFFPWKLFLIQNHQPKDIHIFPPIFTFDFILSTHTRLTLFVPNMIIHISKIGNFILEWFFSETLRKPSPSPSWSFCLLIIILWSKLSSDSLDLYNLLDSFCIPLQIQYWLKNFGLILRFYWTKIEVY